MSETTREVYVLADFVDPQGETHSKGDTITVAYETPRQRREVNQMIYRGFLTLEVNKAKEQAREQEQRERKQESEKQESKEESGSKRDRKSRNQEN